MHRPGVERVNSAAFPDVILASSRFLVDSEAMRPDARAWFEHRTTSAVSLAELDLPALLRAKRRGGHHVSVVLPARDEAATVGPIVERIRRDLVETVPLVDELVVIDSDSTDATAAQAAAAGARVGRSERPRRVGVRGRSGVRRFRGDTWRREGGAEQDHSDAWQRTRKEGKGSAGVHAAISARSSGT